MNPIQKKRAEYEAAIAVLRAKLAVLDELEAELGETPAPVTLPVPTPYLPSAGGTAVLPLSPVPPAVVEVPAGNAPAPTTRQPPGGPPNGSCSRFPTARSGCKTSPGRPAAAWAPRPPVCGAILTCSRR